MTFRKIDLQNVKTDTAHIKDPLIVINSGMSGTNDRDAGIIFDRGSSGNVAIIWDETNSTFSLINTTETGTTVGDVAISSYANLNVHTLTATLSGNVLGNVTGNITSTGTSTFSNIDVAGGEIDNTSIGTNTRAAGAFTTLNTDGDVIIGGNLVVSGTSTTINSQTLTLQDPIINLGGTTAPTTTDGKDRGISFRWHNGSNPKIGFMGFDTSANKFTFVPDAVINSEVLTGGAKGDVDFGDVGGTSATINGNISGYTSTLESSTVDAMLTLTCTDSTSIAGPVVDLIRNSSTPQNSDYLGQIKFKGRNSTSNVKVYAKITGKAGDVDNGTEDGILEFSHIKAGSQNISGRWDSNNLSLINGTGLEVAGNVTISGTTTVSGNILPDTTETYDIGSTTARFNDIYLAGSTVDIGGTKISKDSNGDIDIKDSSNNRKTIRAAAIELVDSQGKKMKLERGNNGKMKTTKMDENGNEEGDQQAIEIENDTSPTLGGNLDANGHNIDMGTNKITDIKVGQWDTAYGWGDHSSAGYITGYTVTESDVTGHQSALSITESQISDLGSYLTSESDTLSSVIGRGNATTTTAVIPFYYADQTAFPSASTYHGAIAHSHSDGAMYFAHSGSWNKLANDSDLTSSIDSHLNQSNPTSGYVLSWNGSDYAWVEQGGSGSGIFTGTGTNDTTQTHDGTKLIIDLDDTDITGSNSTNPTHTSGNAPTLSGGNVLGDPLGIFYVSASNYGTYEDVILRTNGTGVGSTGGFTNPTGAASIFGFRGTSGTATSRHITTANIDTTNYGQMQFYLINGNSSNGGERTDTGDNFKVYYSTNGGSSYTLLTSFAGGSTAYNSWSQVSVNLPVGAKASSVKFKFENLHSSGSYDHWGMSLVQFNDNESVSSEFKVSIDGTNIISSTGGDATTFIGDITGNVVGNQSGGSISATSGSFTSTLQANSNFYANGTYTYLGNSTSDRVYVRTPLFYLNGTQITSTAAEINILDGVTATTAELNYVDGVTSNIQTQLDAKLSSSATTTNVAEGTNLYYTDARADARAQLKIDALIGGAPGTLDTLNEIAAAINDDADVYNTLNGLITTNANNIALKFNTADYNSTFDTRLATKDTGDLAEGTNLYYTDARADARIAAATTDDLSEGSTNLYYTDTRARTHIEGADLNLGTNNITTTGKILFKNKYDTVSDLPSASTYHGMFAHVHATGKGYFAHSSAWKELVDTSSSSGVDIQFNSIGVGTAASTSAGDIRATADVTAYYSSDARLKENVVEIDDALDKVRSIRGVTYDWTDEYIESKGGADDYFMRKHDVGVIAQEIESVLPEIVAERDDGIKAVRYERLTALLIEAVKELSAKVDEQQEQINKFKG